MNLNQAAYDKLKWFVQVVLPAFGALYFGLSDLWGLPYALQVVGTASVVAVFLGAILGISSMNYKKQNEPNGGFIQQTGVDPDTGIPDLGLTLTKLPEELLGKKTITLHVDAPASKS